MKKIVKVSEHILGMLMTLTVIACVLATPFIMFIIH